MKKAEDGSEIPVNAAIEVHAANLTGQKRDVELREISDTEGAIYYIGGIAGTQPGNLSVQDRRRAKGRARKL